MAKDKERPEGAPLLDDAFILEIAPLIDAIRNRYPESLKATRRVQVGRYTSKRIRNKFAKLKLSRKIISFLQGEVLEKVKALKASQTRAAKQTAPKPKEPVATTVEKLILPTLSTRVGLGSFLADKAYHLAASLLMRQQANEDIVPVDSEHADLVSKSSDGRRLSWSLYDDRTQHSQTRRKVRHRSLLHPELDLDLQPA